MMTLRVYPGTGQTNLLTEEFRRGIYGMNVDIR